MSFLKQLLNGWKKGFEDFTNAVNPMSMLTNFAKSASGSGLTDAEKEANQFTHDERIDAQNWTAEREDTEMQRRVQDFKNAGLNPMMAAGAGGVSSSSSGGQSVSPSAPNLGELMQMALIPSQIELTKAQAQQARAGAKEKEARVPYWQTKAEEASKRAELIARQSETEEARKADLIASASLKQANEQEIYTLLEHKSDLLDAQSEQARQDAVLKLMQAMYQNDLNQNGMAKAVVKKVAAETAEAWSKSEEAKASKRKLTAESIETEIENAVKNGTWSSSFAGDDNAPIQDRVMRCLDRVCTTLGKVVSVTNK